MCEFHYYSGMTTIKLNITYTLAIMYMYCPPRGSDGVSDHNVNEQSIQRDIQLMP